MLGGLGRDGFYLLVLLTLSSFSALSTLHSALSLLLALPWLAPFLSLVRLARREPLLGRVPPTQGRLVSVIVPARNESLTIETVVRSVLSSTYEPFELLVVDDRSTDDTAAVVRRLAAGDRRLRLIQGADLPAGWFGKPWACDQGYRHAQGDILVFTDADTRHAPQLLGHAVAALERERASLVTLATHQRCETFWERLVMPQVWLLLGLRYHPRVVNRATRPQDIIANGQFIMVTREAYERAGTHAAVKGEVAEDLALAQAFLRSGAKLHFAFAESLIETRMYTGLAHLIEGWSKNLYLGSRRSFPHSRALQSLAPLLLAGIMFYWLLPPVVLTLGGAGIGHAVIPAALAATAFSALFWMLVSVGMRIPFWYGLGYPLGALVMLYIILRSTWRAGRIVEWKGRVYREVRSEK